MSQRGLLFLYRFVYARNIDYCWSDSVATMLLCRRVLPSFCHCDTVVMWSVISLSHSHSLSLTHSLTIIISLFIIYIPTFRSLDPLHYIHLVINFLCVKSRFYSNAASCLVWRANIFLAVHVDWRSWCWGGARTPDPSSSSLLFRQTSQREQRSTSFSSLRWLLLV